jgi:hypothetical protein
VSGKAATPNNERTAHQRIAAKMSEDGIVIIGLIELIELIEQLPNQPNQPNQPIIQHSP